MGQWFASLLARVIRRIDELHNVVSESDTEGYTMSLTGMPSLKKVDQGYIVRATFAWLSGVSGPVLNLPELFPNAANKFSNGIRDNFQASSYQGNIALPPIKTVRGIIQWNNDSVAYNDVSSLGPLVLIAPDTQDIVVIVPNMSVPNSASHAAGVPQTQYTRMFQLPMYTNGTEIDVLKIADLNPLQTNGTLLLELMTFEAPVIY